jgi:hypothetical protein
MSSDNTVDCADLRALGDFRYAAAGLIKTLLWQRLMEEPDFLPAKEKERWGFKRPAFAPAKANTNLYMWLIRLKQAIDHHFGGGVVCKMGAPLVGVPWMEVLYIDVMNFLTHDVETLRRLHFDKAPFTWFEIADWRYLDEIRDRLDELPHPLDFSSKRYRGFCLDRQFGLTERDSKETPVGTHGFALVPFASPVSG